MTKIILATTSIYRKKAFRVLGLEFIAKGSDINEYFEDRPNTPKELVLYLSKLKADAVSKNYSEGIIVGFDSVGWFKGQILEKPKSRQEAFQRLKSLSRDSFQFYTGIYMKNLETKQYLRKAVVTKVNTRNLTNSEINKYLDQDEKFNTYALGFDPLGHYSSTFISKIEGSYNNILKGIPLEMIVEMLPLVGYKI
ncbi:MAG: Maf family protein [Candidatus Nanoarchaeia archaeon]|nr:Maf family protein [Candidatus Nanoarchaeia archaeon]MDD5588312.1 Maf family protein [Candidatus Nanoarchaeia archaeon]